MKQPKCFEIAQLRLPSETEPEGTSTEIGLYANAKGETLFTMSYAMEMAHTLCKQSKLGQLVRYSPRYEAQNETR